MRIESISYERRASDGNYGNRSFRASATLEEGEDAAAAGDALRRLVCGQMERDVAEEQAREEAERQRLREEREARYMAAAQVVLGRDVTVTVPATEEEDDEDGGGGEDMDDIPFEHESRRVP